MPARHQSIAVPDEVRIAADAGAAKGRVVSSEALARSGHPWLADDEADTDVSGFDQVRRCRVRPCGMRRDQGWREVRPVGAVDQDRRHGSEGSRKVDFAGEHRRQQHPQCALAERSSSAAAEVLRPPGSAGP